MPVKNILTRLLDDKSGATAIEYALLIALLGLGVLTTSQAMGQAFQIIWTSISTQVTTATA